MTEQKGDSTMRDPRLRSLDGERGVAILLVLLSHLGMPGTPVLLDLERINQSRLGDFGVEMFFVLSGFRITTCS